MGITQELNTLDKLKAWFKLQDEAGKAQFAAYFWAEFSRTGGC